MTSAATHISYSNAYSTVLASGAVSNTHPGYGWLHIARASIARLAAAALHWNQTYQAARASHAAAHSAAQVMRVAAALQASQPALANELMAIASRDR